MPESHQPYPTNKAALSNLDAWMKKSRYYCSSKHLPTAGSTQELNTKKQHPSHRRFGHCQCHRPGFASVAKPCLYPPPANAQQEPNNTTREAAKELGGR